jgi:hypothetical protein
MAFNAGAFAGALGTSALNTYERLGEAGYRQMQRAQLVKEIQEKEALDQAWAQSQARVGQQDEYGQAIKAGANVGTQQAQMLSNQGALPGNTAEDQAFEREAAASAVGAMRENAAYNKAGNTGYAAPAEGQRAPQAAIPTLKPTEYTSKQGMQDYLKAASQVSRKGTLEAIQMKGVMRENDVQDKFDAEKTKLDDTLARIQGTAESGGLKGLADAASKEGMKVKFVEGKNGVGSRIQVLGPKGDVLETISDINTATDKLSKVAMESFYNKSVGLLGSPDKVIAAMQSQKQVSLKEREVAAKEALIPSEIAKNQGVAGYYASGGKGTGKQDSLKARAYEYGDLLFENGEKNPQTGKPFASQAEARKYSLGIALKAPESKGITTDANGYVTQNGVLYVPDPKIPGKFVPATGLTNSPVNPVVAAFANYDPNQKSGKRVVKSPQAIETESNP